MFSGPTLKKKKSPQNTLHCFLTKYYALQLSQRMAIVKKNIYIWHLTRAWFHIFRAIYGIAYYFGYTQFTKPWFGLIHSVLFLNLLF